MSWAYLAGSLAAIVGLAWLARQLGYGTPPALDEATARQVARDQFMGERFDRVELAGDGRARLFGPDGPVTVQTVGIRFVRRAMPELISPVTIATPAFVVLVLAEMLWQRRCNPGAYCPKDTLTSLGLGLGSTIAGVVFGGLVLVIAMALWERRLFDVPWTLWAFALCFVLDDLAYYWSHRWMHRVRLMWAAHVIHHSSQHYNLSTALRQTWTGTLALTFLPKLTLFWLGFPPAMVAFVGGLNLVYQFWIHTEAVGRMPRWFEAVMNTPSHHRVHHATNPRYLDRNYAGVFIVWDKLFGTFEPERDDEPCRYGIVKNLTSFNILWAAFHEWIGMIRDVATAKSWRARIGHVLRRPGWRPDGTG